MKTLKIERLGIFEISRKLDKDGDCFIQMEKEVAFLNKDDIQQVIDHLTLLLEEAK